MISILREIKDKSGVVPAITVKSAQIMREVIESAGIRINVAKYQNKIDSIERIITHKSPHLDDYMAILLFRAFLPEEKRLIPLEESVLHSATNDSLAHNTWPSAAVIGIGGTQTGGVPKQRIGILFDEHQSYNQTEQKGSVTEVVLHAFLGPTAPLPPLLFHIIREVNHLDANGGAHSQNISNYIKQIHETRLKIHDPVKGEHFAVSMDASWKESIVNACIISLMLAEKDGKQFWSSNYWKNAASDSLDFFKVNSYQKSDPLFNDANSRLKSVCVGELEKQIMTDKTLLTVNDPKSGGRIPFLDNKGRKLNQRLLLSFIAATNREYWGEDTSNIITMPFLESSIASQIEFTSVLRETKRLISRPADDYTNLRASFGAISWLHTNYSREGIIVRGPVQNKVFAKPAVCYVESNIYTQRAVLKYINDKHYKLGYSLFKNTESGNMVLGKTESIPAPDWERLVDELIRIEGNSDLLPPGSWHKVVGQAGIASFIVNNNDGHRYAPASTLTAQSLVSILNRLNGR